MRLGTKSVLCLLCLSVFLVQTPVFSSEHGQASGLADFLGKTLNFLILFGGLAFILAKPVKRFLHELIISVEKTMTETERARHEAEKELERVERRLKGLAEEVEKIKLEGEKAGQVEKEKILELARQEAERLRGHARREIERYSQAAKRRLLEHAADLAISLAKVRIEKRMTDELHRRVIERSIQGLGKLYEDTRPH